MTQTLYKLGTLMDLQGRTDDAIEYFREAAESPDLDKSSAALVHLGADFFHQDRYDEAREAWSRVLALGHPKYVGYANNNLRVLAKKTDSWRSPRRRKNR